MDRSRAGYGMRDGWDGRRSRGRHRRTRSHGCRDGCHSRGPDSGGGGDVVGVVALKHGGVAFRAAIEGATSPPDAIHEVLAWA